jgi:arginyl-tRNA synthetase
MKRVISNFIFEALEEEKVNISKEEIEGLLEVPPNSEMGDFAFPCFMIAKKMKSPPNEVALIIRQNIGGPPKELKEIQTAGPYVNFFVDRKALALKIVSEIKKAKSKYGSLDKKPKTKIKTMIEFISPNTNKPLHVGHIRNMAIGESVSRISEFNGEKVFRANLNNDRGIHICKSMTAYEEFSKGPKMKKNPKDAKMKSDHFVGYYYSLFGKVSEKSEENKEALEIAAHRMLRNWESGDKKTIELWKKMNQWAFDGWKESYKNFGVKFNKEYYESKIYKQGKEIVLDGLKKGVFKKRKDGAVVINLSKEGLDEKVLLRIDGTTVYITQDIYLAMLKQKEFGLNKSYVVTGNEQIYHFNVLFSILNKLGFKSEGLKHFAYGMVRIPEGKIKSREGIKGLSADEILEKVQNLAKKEIKKRGKISNEELERRSSIIALAAIRYSMLKVDIKKNMLFNPKESISFEGDTGPYILYTYARASSILRKLDKKMEIKLWEELEKKEVELVKKLSEFKVLSEKAYKELNPTIIANYVYQLSQIFNEFYHDCPVIGSDKEHFRISLVECFRIVIKNALNLIGIDTLEEM